MFKLNLKKSMKNTISHSFKEMPAFALKSGQIKEQANCYLF